MKQQIKLRLPPEVKAWIEAEAVRNGASQNAEIARAVREKMDRVTQERSQSAPQVAG